ncbi:CobW family GTP-binding protein [Tateyamaria pelophila]|uniref:CobW family GTP-binding protein n=1 Tax=Tateyamaria pelophila TaxID=328415 RepID=UPI001CBCC419|nr:GTP-binding protein [Tateyamaria pelophila]
MSLPLTVIGGYLGAGKTTLINRLLAEDHGLQLLIMVNDFGAINVDASLIEAAGDDMIALSNGCVCCTMGADLFLAIGDVLDRDLRPDHLVIEASGIADPAAIARVAIAEPDLVYGGVVTVVDALEYDRLSNDPQIGAQVRGQVDVADVVVVSKTDGGAWPEALGVAAVPLAEIDVVGPLVCGMTPAQVPEGLATHPSYVRWHGTMRGAVERSDLIARLEARPVGLFRMKGFVSAPQGRVWEVHCVGRQVTVKEGSGPLGLVGIGLSGRVKRSQLDNWWRGFDL